MYMPNTPIVDGLQINKWSRPLLQESVTAKITAVNATCAVWEGPAETLRNIGDWYQLARDNSDLMLLATSTSDIYKAQRAGLTGILLGFQNTSPFADDYTLVEVFHRLGVRVAQLTYNIQNLVGGSCYEPADSGLTRFGRHIVAEMNRVGMLIDLSHVGNRTSRDAIDASARPVAITHSNPTSFFDSPRNKPKDVIDALVSRDGVIGCCLYPNVIGGEHTTLQQFCSMVAGLSHEIGPSHVAIGSDCTNGWDDRFVEWLRNGRWQPKTESITWPTWPSWFSGPADFPVLADGLHQTGLDDETIAALLGGNWMRLFGQVFAP